MEYFFWINDNFDEQKKNEQTKFKLNFNLFFLSYFQELIHSDIYLLKCTILFHPNYLNKKKTKIFLFLIDTFH